MKKPQRLFICNQCGAEYSRWAGKCETCNSWNTIFEENQSSEKFVASKKLKIENYSKPKSISEIEEEKLIRLSTGFRELDLVLGGGIVQGSLTLIGGEPGVGKSTLLLEIAKNISREKKVLYISGEESSSQISIRARRMKINSKNILLSSEVYVEKIASMIDGESPDLVFIDSIQTISKESLPNQQGSVTQLRECTSALLEVAKKSNIPVFLIGHITKEGSIAGPKLLEHIVDTVLYFDSDKLHYYRLIRGIKNRFGAVGDIAVFEMQSEGLKEILDKHNIFISENRENRIGSAISAIMEGSRSLSVEVQALVSRTTFSQARRTAEGLDTKRLILISAVLEKFMGLKMIECDVFCNLAGGLEIDEPSLDLAISASILSSYLERPIQNETALIGEIGLSGEIRPVSFIQSRIKELTSLGVKKIFLPKSNLKEIETKYKNLELIELENVNQLEKIF